MLHCQFKVVDWFKVFFRKQGLILSEVFSYMERGKNLEKNHNHAKNFIFMRGFDRRNTFFF